MKKSGVFIKALVISGLMVINGQPAVISGSRLSGEICSELLIYQNSKKKTLNTTTIDCIPGTWTGATSTYWNNATNWCDGNIPTSSTNVVIPWGTNYPIINSEAVCNNLTIQPNAYLTILSNNTLTINGDFVNNGNFIPYNSTVIFNGADQNVGNGTYNNLTFKGNGMKTISQNKVILKGILSMEDSATVSGTPGFSIRSVLQYNTPNNITTGTEWPSELTGVDIKIKNTGTIKLKDHKTLTNSFNNTYRSSLTVDENATLDMDVFNIYYPEAINLKCGVLTKKPSIIGSGTLSLENTNVNVTDAAKGTAGAMITCPVKFSGNLIFNIENDAPNIFTDDDLTVRMTSSNGYLEKSGAGTLNLGTSQMSLYYLEIKGGNVTIPVGAQINVSTSVIVSLATSLKIESDINGSGSLIAYAFSGAGKVIVERHMTPRAWHIVSSPISGQSISKFLSANPNIPINTVATVERGMRGYDPSANQWTNFYTNSTLGDILPGKGFGIRVKNSGAQNVTFTGILNAGTISVTGLAAGLWNCVGNPYASALKLNSTRTSDNFIDVNAANLDMIYGAIYIWKQTNEVLNDEDATGEYEPVTNASSLYEVQQCQAFMVKMAPGKNSLSFTNVMQSHNTSLVLKSTDNIWPTIKLIATTDSITSSTIVAFHEGMTPGLDRTYDAGLLRGGAPIEVYTRLIEDNGIPFDIQALPANYESTVVPVGLDCTRGQQVSFSAELMHLPSSCQVILEDRLTRSFTDLSANSYTADLMGKTVSQDRFFLHTSYSTTGTTTIDEIQHLRAWAVSNRELKISGELSSKATAILYDIQGRLILSEQLKAGFYHTIRLSEINPGIYVLYVGDKENKQVLKLFISK